MVITYQTIGIINSPFKNIEKMPIQPGGALGIAGSIELDEKYVPALKDLEGFSHIYILYHFHRVNGWKPVVTPFLDNTARGLFATRAPKRPNPIGLSVVRLLGIKGNQLKIENVDVLDGTPLLDIKPYLSDFDHFKETSSGWLQDVSEEVKHTRSDQRFKDD